MPVRLVSGADAARSGGTPLLRGDDGGWFERDSILVNLQDSPGREREERGQDKEKRGERRKFLQ